MLHLVHHQNNIIDILVIRITKQPRYEKTNSRKNIIVTRL